ncbi:hypothetical protein PX701_05845 [Agromyces sp. H3Y2-19a]|jgi:hypothetical protein|uniref:hypothetical protein n=1 Tax=Agromyces TaxID=33877 RepID=UPI001E483984|nr:MULTISPECIES: hypothetical protein [Agromyces]MCD5346778.1 hypothetical protein [Agromyces sp. S2-1-8]MDF0513138.1 hypothetical protein [Agromyces chromiiresistens]
MTAEPLAPEASAPSRRVPMWLDVALATLFGLFYAYDVWEVVESVVQLLGIGLTFSPAGWAIMTVAFLAPFACFFAAFALGRSRGVLPRVALYFTGLCVSGALFLSCTVLLGLVRGVVVG